MNAYATYMLALFCFLSILNYRKMKSYLFSLLLATIGLSLFGQDKNIFWDRTFWRSRPDVATIQAKITAGNDPVALNKYAFDATTYAIIDKAPNESIKYLLDIKGNEATKLTHDGRNYLMWAAYAGNVEITQELIKRGSDIDLVDEHGYAVIPFCATTGQKNTEIYDLLIKSGARVDLTNRDGANAMLLIAKHLEDDLTMIDYFKSKGIKLASTDDAGNGLFNYAAIKGNMAMMKKAIEWNLPYKELNLNGGNAMIFASRGYRGSTNTLELYQYLAELGVEANVVTKDGETPLHSIAYRTKDMAIYEFFINNGVNINQADKDGNTLLLNAVKRGNVEVALKFIPKVANINHINKDGYSALTYAVRGNNPTLIEALIKAGANTDLIDNKGNNLAGHLFDAFNDGQEAEFETKLRMLQDQSVIFTTAQAKGNSLLHIAVDKNSPFLVEQALHLGININAKNRDGLAPLHLAAMKAQDPALLNLLIAKGADKNVKTSFDETVYDLASENELLRQTGFDPEKLKK